MCGKGGSGTGTGPTGADSGFVGAAICPGWKLWSYIHVRAGSDPPAVTISLRFASRSGTTRVCRAGRIIARPITILVHSYRDILPSDAPVNQLRVCTDTDSMNWYPTPELSNAAGSLTARSAWAVRLLHWVADARAHRVICLVLGIWLLNGFDLVFTVMSHQHGMLHEENPLARHMLQYGTASIVLYKAGLVMIGSYPLLRFRKARIAELGSFVILAAYAFLALRWSTCVELYTFTATGADNFAGIENLLGTTTE